MENDRLANKVNKLTYDLTKKNLHLEEALKKIEMLEKLKGDGNYVNDERYTMLKRENECLELSIRDANFKLNAAQIQITNLENTIFSLRNNWKDGPNLNKDLETLLEQLAHEREKLRRENLFKDNELRSSSIENHNRIKDLNNNCQLLFKENER